MAVKVTEWRLPPHLKEFLLAGAVGLCLWEAVPRLFSFRFFLPFTAVLETSIRLLAKPQVQAHLLASIVSLLTGFSLAALFGVIVGALMGRYRAIQYLLDLYIDAFLASPSLIYVPILFAFFGVGRVTQIAVVFLYSFFVIVAYTMTGVQSVDRSLLEMARSFGANERQLFSRVTLPAAFPAVLTGLRIAAGRAVKGMINGEMFIAFTGLGALLRTAGDRLNRAEVWALLLIIMAVALIFIAGLQALCGRALKAFAGSSR